MISEKTREILRIAFREGGRILMDHFGSSLETTVKESNSSVVTDADYASEKKILEVLGDSATPCNIISEEAGYIHDGSAYTWVVDPLDGTSNFAAGLPWFGIIITLLREADPVLGGMFLPVENILYLAEKGKGAWREGRPIRTSGSANLTQQLVSYSFDHSSEPGKTDREMKLLARLSKHVRNIRSTNSLYDFCYVADGRVGAAMNQTTKIWDISAALLLIPEAGGIVTDMQGNPIALDIGRETCMQNYTIAAAGKKMHQTLMNIINPS
jgi:myo-inositol-1(or 4)-monophosphatase